MIRYLIFAFKFLQDIIAAAETIAAAADQFTEEVAGSIDMSTFLYQTGRSYYYYKGSLTTPPCTETVDWHVMEGAIRITEEDVSLMISIKIFWLLVPSFGALQYYQRDFSEIFF